MLWKDRLIMPQIHFLRSQIFKNFLKLLAGNIEIYILYEVYIDSVKVSYQNNHIVDCKLVFRKF